MRNKIYVVLTVLMLLFVFGTKTFAQKDTLTLNGAIDAALKNNHLLNIKKMQVEERKAKVKEDEVKKYPVAILNSTYLYNVNTNDPLPLNTSSTVPLPFPDKYMELGEHNTFNAALAIYQPITQQGKIRTNIDISKTNVLISEKEQKKVAQQIRQSVEKIYYGLLINEKQNEEAASRLKAAKMKLFDVESALLAGKTVTVEKAGLQANIADEEQNMLKLDIQAQDYRGDLKQITGLVADSFFLAKVEVEPIATPSLEESRSVAFVDNVDLKIANYNDTKAKLGIKAARQSYLPDVGLVGGYLYQKGNGVLPDNNPFAGVNFKWNIQDVISNRQVIKQRVLLSKQASENVVNTQEVLMNEVEKAQNKIRQSKSMITVAQKAVKYRKEELQIQLDKTAAGLNTESDVLLAQSLLARSEAGLYEAQLSYRLAVLDLSILEGK
jgi:outer membrane protein